jgi:hypothetical protein
VGSVVVDHHVACADAARDRGGANQRRDRDLRADPSGRDQRGGTFADTFAACHVREIALDRAGSVAVGQQREPYDQRGRHQRCRLLLEALVTQDGRDRLLAAVQSVCGQLGHGRCERFRPARLAVRSGSA